MEVIIVIFFLDMGGLSELPLCVKHLERCPACNKHNSFIFIFVAIATIIIISITVNRASTVLQQLAICIEHAELLIAEGSFVK